jgi:hypothetical protein
MISIFKSAKVTTPDRTLSVEAFFDNVKNGAWQDQVLAYRSGNLAKTSLECVTASGVFERRAANAITEHSGLICLDIDAKDQIHDFDVEQIKKDEYTHAVHRSVSGFGFAVYVKIDPKKHADAFLGLQEYYLKKFKVVLDKSCKDVSRLRFVSYDPDLTLNAKAKKFREYLKKEEKQRTQIKTITVKSDFEEMVVKAAPMNLFDDYHEYIRLAFALVDEFGENGRNYFHTLCSSSEKYEYKQAEKDYDKALKRNQSGVTISTVYYVFKQAGISIISEKTLSIKRIAKLAPDPKKALEEAGIKDDENLLDFFNEKEEKAEGEIGEVIELIKLTGIKFNEVTRNFEINGEELTDRDLAEFYTQVWVKIDEDFSKDKIWTLIQNKKNTPSFNPIRDFFAYNKSIKTDNEFEKLKRCFNYTAPLIEDGGARNAQSYLDVFLKKWLLGIIGSAHGTYSLMILVLVGEQGIKKTEFFRNLLPKELRKYYSESNLDEGKDSEILMCKKLLIVDDEFGGKSKKDATKLKRLSSQQTFSIRAPYGRVSEDLNRLAVLGGTSNETDVINDPTGNRRIIPINLISFDLEQFKAINKTALFIELYREWEENKEGWFLTQDEIALLNRTTIRNTEIWQEEELLNKYAEHCAACELTSTEIKLKLEGLHPSFRSNAKRIGQALKKLGYEQKIVKSGGKTKRVYEISLNTLSDTPY